MVDALAETVALHGDEPAYSDRSPAADGWRTLTWSELHASVLDLAGGLVRLGLEPGDVVALMLSNRLEHVLADMAAVHAGGTPMTVYATLAPEQVAFIAGNSRPTVVVLEGPAQLARWADALAGESSIRHVVVIEPVESDDPRVVAWADLPHHDPAAVAARTEALTPDTPLTILYTSGTTGNPKGVVLTHANMLFEAASNVVTTGMTVQGRSISYLPFAHVAERTLSMYVPQVHGGHVHLLGDASKLAATLAEVRPARFFGVPRVWEKLMAGLSAVLATQDDPAVTAAMAAGLAWVEGQQAGGTPSAEVVAAFEAADPLLARLRGLLGFDECQFAASAAAPMPLEVARFFAGLGVIVYDVWGMTETSGTVTANKHPAFRLGSVGKPLLGLAVKLADDGEILVQGPVMTPGYLGNPAATAELVPDDGWLRTGDIGRLDDDGFLYVVDRKKEMIITSSGKNIAPSRIESLLKESPLVGHAFVSGDGKPYVVALLTLDSELAPVLASRMGLTGLSLAELAAHPAVLEQVSSAVEAANARLSRPEQVKTFALLPNEWTAESGELTPTLKLKRRVVSSTYATELAGLYS